MFNNKKVAAIVLVAGNSTRFGKNCNKNFELINDKPVFIYSVEKFDSNDYVDEIVIAAKKSEFETIQMEIDKRKLNKKIKIIAGGKTRKESVGNCIKQSYADIVIIHDGARPLIKQEYIDECIRGMKIYKGVTVGAKTKDTIKISDENNIVKLTTRRDHTWLIQTPQCFDKKVLLDMHQKYKDDDFTDDCSLLEKDSYKIKIIPGDYTNIKITTREDLDIARRFFNT